MPLDQPPGFLAVQPLAGQQDRGGAAGDLRQRVDAGAVRQRRHHQRGILLRRRRHQVAQMVADDIIHLAMRQHAGLGPAGGAGGVEEPGRMVAVHVGRPGQLRGVRRRTPPSRRRRRRRWKSPAGRPGFPLAAAAAWSGKAVVEDMHRGAGGLRQIGDLRRRQAEIGRHPDRADHPRREHRLQHGVGVARVQQDPVAVAHAARRQRGGRGLDPVAKRCPGPGGVAPDDRRPVGKPPRGLDQQRGEVGGRDQPRGQRSGSRIET